MTKWFAYFKDEGKRPYFRLVAAEGLHTAEMMSEGLASRGKEEFIGIIIAPELYQERQAKGE
ncbi:hypothetical protein LCGC14_1553350 [marine sediment metagenome]|uniref:Uncharacterized protein n=1 Tax=marine sediment metagenome TaxID=412755 RepID=A0A0F9IPS6_9ZZZZ